MPLMSSHRVIVSRRWTRPGRWSLLPPVCAACRVPGVALCDTCVAALRPAEPRTVPDGVGDMVVLFSYESSGAAVVRSLKFAGLTSVAPLLAAAMAAVAPDLVEVVVPVPTSARRRRMRGFDQAELLARLVAAELGLRAVRALSRSGVPQTRRTGRERRSGPRVNLRRLGGPQIEGRRVLLVDDVVTTGATLSVCAGVLLEGGAVGVDAAVVASTPRRRGRGVGQVSRS